MLVTSIFPFFHYVFKGDFCGKFWRQCHYEFCHCILKIMYVTDKMKFVLGRIENIVGQGENAGYQHFPLFPLCFQKAVCGNFWRQCHYEICHCILKIMYVTDKMKFVLGRIENIVGQGENAVTSIFPFFHYVFKRLFVAIFEDNATMSFATVFWKSCIVYCAKPKVVDPIRIHFFFKKL